MPQCENDTSTHYAGYLSITISGQNTEAFYYSTKRNGTFTLVPCLYNAFEKFEFFSFYNGKFSFLDKG